MQNEVKCKVNWHLYKNSVFPIVPKGVHAASNEHSMFVRNRKKSMLHQHKRICTAVQVIVWSRWRGGRALQIRWKKSGSWRSARMQGRKKGSTTNISSRCFYSRHWAACWLVVLQWRHRHTEGPRLRPHPLHEEHQECWRCPRYLAECAATSWSAVRNSGGSCIPSFTVFVEYVQ